MEKFSITGASSTGVWLYLITSFWQASMVNFWSFERLTFYAYQVGIKGFKIMACEGYSSSISFKIFSNSFSTVVSLALMLGLGVTELSKGLGENFANVFTLEV
jgi:hypothetical protein